MLTRQAFLLHYKALMEYAELRALLVPLSKKIPDLEPLKPYQADYIWHFLRPYVCVIHESGRGYYLDRGYQHIVSVANIPNPTVQENGVPAELQRFLPRETIPSQAASCTTPDWTKDLPFSSFTSYWLY